MRHPYYTIGTSPEKHFCTDTAVISLMKEGLVYIGEGPGTTACLFACTDDIFHSGSDHLILRRKDIQDLYDTCYAKGKVGFVSWCARHAWKRPVDKWVNILKEDGLWAASCEGYTRPGVAVFPANVAV